MKNFYVIANIGSKGASDKADEVIEYLKGHGAKIVKKTSDYTNSTSVLYKYTNPEDVPKDTEAVIVIGGDGTMIQAARDLMSLELPLIGINYGALGFLAEIEKDNFKETLDKLLCDEYKIEERLLISARVYNTKGNEKLYNFALNDIAISRSGSVRLIDYNIKVNGLDLNAYRADGLIISTPTGSTAYNLSAGGPIVKPNADLLVVTPICPHTLSSRSIILDADDEIDVEILPKKHEGGVERLIVFDGNDDTVLADGDYIHIKKSERKVKIINTKSESFIQTLRRKMWADEDSQIK